MAHRHFSPPHRPFRSLAARGTLLVLLAAASAGVPTAIAVRSRDAHDDRVRQSALQATLAVAVTAFLEAQTEPDSTATAWLERLAAQNLRVRWAGAFDRNRDGVEIRRRVAMPREAFLAQIQFDAQAPAVRPFQYGQEVSDRFYMITVPQEDGCVAAVVDLGYREKDTAALTLTYCVAAGLIGLTLSFGLLQRGILAPIRRISSSVADIRSGIEDAALPLEAPAELASLARSAAEVRGELEKWQSEATHLRESMERRVDAKTQKAERAVRAAERDAGTDALSGLHNRRTLERELPALYDAQRRCGGDLCAIWIDLDNFKRLNDTLGHQTGDKLIAFVGELIRAAVRRECDLGVRYGGDEFVIVMPGMSLGDGMQIARRLVTLIIQKARTLPKVDPPPGASAGVASLHEHLPKTPDDLLKLADQAMYLAKKRADGVATIDDRTRA